MMQQFRKSSGDEEVLSCRRFKQMLNLFTDLNSKLVVFFLDYYQKFTVKV